MSNRVIPSADSACDVAHHSERLRLLLRHTLQVFCLTAISCCLSCAERLSQSPNLETAVERKSAQLARIKPGTTEPAVLRSLGTPDEIREVEVGLDPTNSAAYQWAYGT